MFELLGFLNFGFEALTEALQLQWVVVVTPMVVHRLIFASLQACLFNFQNRFLPLK